MSTDILHLAAWRGGECSVETCETQVASLRTARRGLTVVGRERRVASTASTSITIETIENFSINHVHGWT